MLVSGAALQWLETGSGILGSAAESERLATQRRVERRGRLRPCADRARAPRTGFPKCAALITGITRGTTASHLVRATLEAIAHQAADVVEVLPLRVDVLRADGGASGNAFLMQLQADLRGCPVEVAAETETTALGAAALAGLAVGLWRDLGEVGGAHPPRRAIRAGRARQRRRAA